MAPVRKDDTQNREAFLFALFFNRPTVFAYFDVFYQAPGQDLGKARITRSSFLHNFLASMFSELSHPDAIFLLSFLPDGSVSLFFQKKTYEQKTVFLAILP